MKHKIIPLLLSLLCFLGLTTTLVASTPRVNDLANLLSLDEIENLEQSLDLLTETYQMDIVIVTTNDAQGKTAEAYADDFYDEHGYGYGNNYDGALFLIDMQNRKFHISTSGLAARYLSNARIVSLKQAVTSPLSIGDYYGACNTFISNVEKYFKSGIPANSPLNFEGGKKPFTDEYNNPLEVTDYLICAGIALLAGLLVAFIVRSIVSYMYKHPRHTVPATLPENSSVRYSEKQDHFISTHTTKTKIQSSGSGGGGGGGSSMHRSSSGRSHGGGGGSF